MTTQEVANRFYELCLQGAYDVIQTELFSSDAKSIEPAHAGFIANADGIEAIKEKGRQFGAMVEAMHGGYCNQPIVAGNFFACTMGMDVTMKGQPRMQMDEVAVYEVKDGKIVLEQFFY